MQPTRIEWNGWESGIIHERTGDGALFWDRCCVEVSVGMVSLLRWSWSWSWIWNWNRALRLWVHVGKVVAVFHVVSTYVPLGGEVDWSEVGGRRSAWRSERAASDQARLAPSRPVPSRPAPSFLFC
jgi:hypothetical protein